MISRPDAVPDLKQLTPPKGADRERLDRRIERDGLAAVVAMGPENFHYLSGVWLPMARGYLDRQNIAICEPGEQLILLTGVDWAMPIRNGAPQAQIRTYDEAGAMPPAVIVEALADALKERGLGNKRIGIEGLRTSMLMMEALRALLPDATFVPCDDIFRDCRAIKSADEIEVMRTLAVRTDIAIRRALSRGSVGMSERDLAAVLLTEIMSEGASSVTSILLGSGDRTTGLAAPTEKIIEKDELIRIDLNSIWMGYYCDVGRMACAGEPSAQLRKDYADHVDFKQAIFDMMRPGVACSEVFAFYEKQAADRGLDLFRYPYIGLGHSTGVNNDEFPKLNKGHDAQLQPGMIMNVEPDTLGSRGEIYHVEDMVLLKEDGVEVITWSRDWSSHDMPVLGA